MPKLELEYGKEASEYPTPSSRYELRRSRIINEATILLNEKGAAGLTLQDVAQRLGLKATAATYYFRYKEQLIVAVFQRSLNKLAEMASTASTEPDPRSRVKHYLARHFNHHHNVRHGQEVPIAIFSEIRSLEDNAKWKLIAQYQQIFRTVRSFFGSIRTSEEKLDFSARAQQLNEALFWSANWLKDYDTSDFDLVRRQTFQVLENGILGNGFGPLLYQLSEYKPNDTNDNYASFLKVATRLLNESGYRGTSIDRIAAEVNLTKGSFYHKLATKDELILECFRNSYERFAGLYKSTSRSKLNNTEILLHVIANAIGIQLEGSYPLLRTTAFQALPPSLRSIPYQQSQRTALLLTGLIVDAWQEGATCPVNPLLASHIIMSTVNSAFDMRSWAAKQDFEQAVGSYIRILANGIFAD